MLKPPREKDFAAVACVPLPSLQKLVFVRSFVRTLVVVATAARGDGGAANGGGGGAVMVLRLPMQLTSTVVDDQKAIVYNAVHRHTTLGWHVFSRRSSTTVRAEQETTYDMYPKAMTGNITMG